MYQSTKASLLTLSIYGKGEFEVAVKKQAADTCPTKYRIYNIFISTAYHLI